ncbi:hypothetical protein EJ03DRAFT_327620 [Teratosphaeria nubilosa]|uniref:TAFII28-like protein domain-containing protein n=1 Tax=Teratosphaeria nubilosa TaxID=161662 RepID=A0A6G1L8H9_9PEZI|nr:hypothetical protein EJ03DRAFT_327620 [Teratosphaeria nubilosa]
MASPPHYGGSPPAPPSLALPKQRPQLALPTGIKTQPSSRKPSIANSASSAHPLRQTSFPPPDSLEAQHMLAEDDLLRRQQYSPSADGSEAHDELSDDNDIRSAISGPSGGLMMGGEMPRKRRRGEKRPRGRPAKQGARFGSVSLVNGEDGGKRGGTAGARSSTGQDGEGEADEDEDEEPDETDARGGRVPLYAGGEMTAEEIDEIKERRNLFYNLAGGPVKDVPMSHRDRYSNYLMSKVGNNDVRKLVNQVLGQSVPKNVVTIVQAYAKLFAGRLIEEAREVQAEWFAVEERRADGTENPVCKKLKRSREGRGAEEANGSAEEKGEKMDGVETNARIKPEPASPSAGTSLATTLPNGTQDDAAPSSSKPSSGDVLRPGGAGGLIRHLEEWDRGPLLPDHLREALRRYRKRRGGGSVGFTGLSLEGAQGTAAKMGGRRLFR